MCKETGNNGIPVLLDDNNDQEDINRNTDDLSDEEEDNNDQEALPHRTERQLTRRHAGQESGFKR